MDLYVLVFVVESLIDEIKVYDYVPTNSPPTSLRVCEMMRQASSERLECIQKEILDGN